MIALGIDPGLGRTGYAVLEKKSQRIRLLQSGCINTNLKDTEAKRLLEINNDLTSLIKHWQPDLMCVEKLFFANNAKTVMSVGQARGVIVLVSAKQRLKLIELTPMQVKMSITGYGKADKRQVQTMVVKLLGLKKIPKPDDAADAVAIAWAGINRIDIS